MIRVLIADDHAIVRQGLRHVLALAPDIELAGEAKSASEVFALMQTEKIDVLLTDLYMADTNGIDLIKSVHQLNPRVAIIVLTMHNSEQLFDRAVRAGAAGYLTKNCEPETLLAGIQHVAAGGCYVDPDIASKILFKTTVLGDETRRKLTERESQIFIMLAQGQGTKEIATTLGLSAKTISTHKYRLMEKLGVENISELVRYAVNLNLLT
jgi:DNA-binding NarL/FixJ family response regulator